MFQVIDNFLPTSYADSLEHMCKLDVSWNVMDNKSGVMSKSYEAPGANYSGFQYGFSHSVLGYKGEQSKFFDKTWPMLYFIEEKANIKVNHVDRIRLGLTTSMGKEVQQYPHVDEPEPHNVLLYYVNDSDGDTFMFNEMYQEGVDQTEFTIKERVTPKKNRAILFDGLTYHSASSPVNNALRFVVNINFR
jgi:hypothetical protein